MIFETIIFCILCYTLSSIIVEQKIFEEGRNWLKQCSASANPDWFRRKLCQLMSCMFCTGFWSALFICIVCGYMPLSVIGLGYILHGLLGAFSSYLIYLGMSIIIKKVSDLGLNT